MNFHTWFAMEVVKTVMSRPLFTRKAMTNQLMIFLLNIANNSSLLNRSEPMLYGGPLYVWEKGPHLPRVGKGNLLSHQGHHYSDFTVVASTSIHIISSTVSDLFCHLL